MKLHCALMAIACTLVLAGCLPVTSKTPIGTTAGLGADETLYGSWTGHGDDGTAVTFHFVPAHDADTLAIMVSAKHAKSKPEASFYVLQTAKLGDNRFLNVTKMFGADNLQENQLNGANMPLLYKFGRNGRLTLYLLDEDKTKEAIHAGLIAGIVGGGDNGDVEITADAAALDAFMAKPEAAKLFKLLIVLKRVE